MRDYTLNQIKRFVKDYIKDYDHYRAAMNTGIELDDVNALIISKKFVELLNNPVNPSGKQPFERVEEIKWDLCNWVSHGKTLADFCRQDGVPKPATLYKWMEQDSDFNREFAHARKTGYDLIAMDMLRIADTPVDEYVREMTEESSTNGSTTREKITKKDATQHRKLQIDTRKWLLGKWDPKRYGDVLKAQLTGKDDEPIETKSTVTVDDKDLARRLAFLLNKGSKK